MAVPANPVPYRLVFLDAGRVAVCGISGKAIHLAVCPDNNWIIEEDPIRRPFPTFEEALLCARELGADVSSSRDFK